MVAGCSKHASDKSNAKYHVFKQSAWTVFWFFVALLTEFYSNALFLYPFKKGIEEECWAKIG